MAVNEFELDDVFDELNRKFANVSLDQSSMGYYKEITRDDLFEYRDILELSSDYQSCHEAMRNIRRYLTQNITLDRIQNVLDLGLEGRIKTILETPGYDELKYETAWTITNLAYGTKEQTFVLLESGILESLIYCFRTNENYRLKSQTAWAFANISIDSPDYREKLALEEIIGDVAQTLSNKCELIYQKLISVIHAQEIYEDNEGHIVCNNKTDSDDVKDLTWSLSNLCRGGFRTSEHWKQYLAAFTAFSYCIFFNNNDVWTEACWGLSRILSNMYNNDYFFQYLQINPRLCPRLVELLQTTESDKDMLSVLQTISNFSSGPNHYVELLLDAGLLNNIGRFITHDTPTLLRRNAILTIANFAAGNEKITRRVVYNQNIMQNVMAHITIPGHIFEWDNYKWLASNKASSPEKKEEWRILKEALWVLSNIVTLANDDCICALLRNYNKLVQLLSSLFYFPRLHTPICLKIVDILIRIIDRTNQIPELTPPVAPIPRNPYAEEMMHGGVIQSLSYLCRETGSPELVGQSEILYTAIATSCPQSFSPTKEIAHSIGGMSAAFGLSQYGIQLPKPNVRRIVHGYEDGDVRFIESAINNIQL